MSQVRVDRQTIDALTGIGVDLGYPAFELPEVFAPTLQLASLEQNAPPMRGVEMGFWIEEGSSIGLHSGAQWRALPTVGFWVTELWCSTNRALWVVHEPGTIALTGAASPASTLIGVEQAIGANSTYNPWLADFRSGTFVAPPLSPQFGATRNNAADPPIWVPANNLFSVMMTTVTTNANIAVRMRFSPITPWFP